MAFEMDAVPYNFRYGEPEIISPVNTRDAPAGFKAEASNGNCRALADDTRVCAFNHPNLGCTFCGEPNCDALDRTDGRSVMFAPMEPGDEIPDLP